MIIPTGEIIFLQDVIKIVQGLINLTGIIFSTGGKYFPQDNFKQVIFLQEIPSDYYNPMESFVQILLEFKFMQEFL